MVMYLSGMLYFYFISNYVISMPVTWGIVLVWCFLLTVGGDFLLCVLASALAVRLLPDITEDTVKLKFYDIFICLKNGGNSACGRAIL